MRRLAGARLCASRRQRAFCTGLDKIALIDRLASASRFRSTSWSARRLVTGDLARSGVARLSHGPTLSVGHEGT